VPGADGPRPGAAGDVCHHQEGQAGLLAHRGVTLVRASPTLLLEEADDGAQGRRARGLIGTGKVHGLPEVREGLVTAPAETEPGQSARPLEEGHENVAGRGHAAEAVEPGEELPGRGHQVAVAGVVRDRSQVVEVGPTRDVLPEVVVGETEEGRAKYSFPPTKR